MAFSNNCSVLKKSKEVPKIHDEQNIKNLNFEGTFFLGGACLWHGGSSQAQDQTLATSITRVTAVTRPGPSPTETPGNSSQNLNFGRTRVGLTHLTPVWERMVLWSDRLGKCHAPHTPTSLPHPHHLGGLGSPAQEGLTVYVQPFCKLETVPLLGTHSP